MPTRYTIKAEVYSGFLWQRERISSAPTPTPSANCLLENEVDFSCIQHHEQGKKKCVFLAAHSLNKIGLDLTVEG